jgi:hypothetical protein
MPTHKDKDKEQKEKYTAQKGVERLEPIEPIEPVDPVDPEQAKDGTVERPPTNMKPDNTLPLPERTSSPVPPIITHIGGLPGVYVSGPNA